MFVDRRARQSGTRAPGRLTCSKGRHHVVVCGLATPSRELARRKDQAASAPRPPLRPVGWGLVRHRTDEAGPLVDRLEHAPPRRGVGRPEPWELVAPLVREVWAVGCFSGSVVLWFPSRRIPPPMRAQSTGNLVVCRFLSQPGQETRPRHAIAALDWPSARQDRMPGKMALAVGPLPQPRSATEANRKCG